MTTLTASPTPAGAVAARSCVICGSTRRLENRHIAPAWPLTVTLCHKCHQSQTRLAWATGVLGVPESVGQQMWAVVHGLLALVIARARATGADTAHLRSAHRSVLRLLAEITETPLGPDPARNTYRGDDL